MSQLHRFDVRWTPESLTVKTRKRLLKFCKAFCDLYIAQAEEGTQHDTGHWQCYLQLKEKKRQSHMLRLLLRHLKEPQATRLHVRPTSMGGSEALQFYCQKSETRIDGPYSNKPLQLPYNGEELPTTLLPWQQKLFDHLQTPPPRCTINWIYDEAGGCGKTQFCKYMGFHHNAGVIRWGKSADLLNLYVQQGIRTIWMVDLTRAKPTDIGQADLYSTIESIKDGMVCATKYQGKIIFTKPPHVVVFANMAPHLASLSSRRWNIVQLRQEDQAPPPPDEERFVL